MIIEEFIDAEILNSLNTKLNSYFNINQRNKSFQYSMLNKTSDVARIIINNYFDDKSEYNMKISIEDTIKIAQSFLNKINKNYAIYFEELINKNKIKIQSWEIIDGKPTNKSRTEENNIILETSNTLDDVYTLIHEFTHLLSYNEKRGIISSIYGESTAIAMENILENYLLENTNLPKEEILKQKIQRKKQSYFCAKNLLLEYEIINEYMQNGTINQNSIRNIIKKGYTIKDITNCITKINKLSDNTKNLPYERNMKYVIGTVLASYFEQEHLKHNNINKLFSFIDIMKQDNKNEKNYINHVTKLFTKCNQIGIPLINGNTPTFSKEEINLVTSTYKKSYEENKSKNELNTNKTKQIKFYKQIKQKLEKIKLKKDSEKNSNKPKIKSLTNQSHININSNNGKINIIFLIFILISISQLFFLLILKFLYN